MARFTDASHNVLFTLNASKWAHDLDITFSKADLIGFQEAGARNARRAIRAAAQRHGFEVFMPKGSGDPIAWNPEVFEALPARGIERVHDGADFMRYNPARYLTWQGFTHQATGKTVLRLNLHCTAGYAKPEPNEWGEKGNEWKNDAARAYWLAVTEFLAREMRSGQWDVILIGGDFNARLNNEAEWYFPGPMLSGLIVVDDAPRSIDRLVYTKDSATTQVRRWSRNKGVYSDHALHFATYRL